MNVNHRQQGQRQQHHKVVIIGSGISGLTSLIQLKRKLGLSGTNDVRVYEKGNELGGTWAKNCYPGATSDIPISFYSASFSPAKNFSTQWPSSFEILSYWKNLVYKKYSVSSQITYQTLIVSAKFLKEFGIWELEIKDLKTNEIRIETCNVLISAVGALSTPSPPPFDISKFKGKIVHTGEWDKSIDLKDKNVVVLGNGCTSAGLIPAIIDQVKSLTQIARSKHSIVPPVKVPDNYWTNFLVRWIPGLITVFRFAVFFLCESYFWMNQDSEKAKKGRSRMKKISDDYIEKTAPEKYWDQLKYDFEFGQKRRIIDFKHYTTCLHSPKFNLIQPDTISSVSGKTLTTQQGLVIEDVDVIILSTGFKVTNYLGDLKILNEENEDLVERFKKNGVKTYLTSMVHSYPNFFMLMGPGSVTGHSSVLFNSECTILMMIELLRPVFKSISEQESITSISTTPSIQTEADAEAEELEKPSSPPDDDHKLIETEFSRSPFDEKFPFHRGDDQVSLPPRIETVVQAPFVQVTQEAEDEWYQSMRKEMEKLIWEPKQQDGKVSWYTDQEQNGKCTTLYPWSQIHFKNSTQKIIKERFVWSNC
ncbi:hypothetical protein JCM3765_000484 [Sporobolomyces pararoseus]